MPVYFEIQVSSIQNIYCQQIIPLRYFSQGYLLRRRQGDKTQTLALCEPCGRAVRGKQKLERINDLRDFACCMGQGRLYI